MRYSLLLVCLYSGISYADQITQHTESITLKDVYHAKPDDAQHYIDLDSPALHLVDGNFLNGDTVERVLSFKREILSIMWGDRQTDGTRVGRYQFFDHRASAHELAQSEHDLIIHDKDYVSQRNECLKQMKKDFLKASNKLKIIARGAKPAMGMLIEYSCQKRHRMDSILLIWAHTPEEEEDPIFDNKVKNVGEFCIFCIDLLNFIGDLIHSCPKARAQFEHRIEKWKKFENILATLNNKQPELEFLKWVKINHLDRLSIEQITAATIKQLLTEFSKQHAHS